MRIFFCAIIWLVLSQQALAAPPQTSDELMDAVEKTAKYGGIALLCDDKQTSIEASSHFTHLVNVALLRGLFLVHQESDYYRAYIDRAKSFYAMLQNQQRRGIQPPMDGCQDNATSFTAFKTSTAYDLSKDPRMAEALQALNGRIAGGDGSDDPKLAKAYAILQERTGDISAPVVTDSYDLLKSNPLLAKGLEILQNPSQNLTSGHGPEAQKKQDPALTGVVLAIVVCSILIAKNLSEKAPAGRYEGTLAIRGKPYWWVIAGLGFILLKGLVDLYVAISDDNALNLIFGLFGIGCALMPFTERYRRRFLLVGGCWMAGRGVLNLLLFISVTEGLGGLGEFLATMPIRVLPNFILSYVLPILIGAHFLRLHKKNARLAGE